MARALLQSGKKINKIVISGVCILLAYYLAMPAQQIVSPDAGSEALQVEPVQPDNLISEEPVTIESGDTLAAVLRKQSISNAQVNEAIKAIQKVFNLRDLRPSHELYITTSPNEEGETRNLLTLLLRPSFNKEISLEQQEDGTFKAQKALRTLERHIKSASGSIKSSLYVDAINLGIPSKAVHKMITAFSYDVDFQRSIHPGNKFRIIYELLHDPKNKSADVGRVLLAEMEIDGEMITVYYFDESEQWTGYYHASGRSVQRSLLRTPVDGARISSGYGRRKHPILGFTKLHKGVDFAAPTGTPIYAAGAGVVERAGRFGSYGNYIRIRHFGTILKTAYAHLSRFAKGMRSGKSVKQGQIIGYVGATGRAKGAHLHYEVIKNGVQVNPMKVKTENNITLQGKIKESFLKRVKTINALAERSAKATKKKPLIVDKKLSVMIEPLKTANKKA